MEKDLQKSTTVKTVALLVLCIFLAICNMKLRNKTYDLDITYNSLEAADNLSKEKIISLLKETKDAQNLEKRINETVKNLGYIKVKGYEGGFSDTFWSFTLFSEEMGTSKNEMIFIDLAGIDFEINLVILGFYIALFYCLPSFKNVFKQSFSKRETFVNLVDLSFEFVTGVLGTWVGVVFVEWFIIAVITGWE